MDDSSNNDDIVLNMPHWDKAYLTGQYNRDVWLNPINQNFVTHLNMTL